MANLDDSSLELRFFQDRDFVVGHSAGEGGSRIVLSKSAEEEIRRLTTDNGLSPEQFIAYGLTVARHIVKNEAYGLPVWVGYPESCLRAMPVRVAY